MLTRNALPFTELPPIEKMSAIDLTVRAWLDGLMFGGVLLAIGLLIYSIIGWAMS